MKKIAILTSGGDSQGMSAAVLAVIKACQKRRIMPYIVRDGYYGLCHNLIEPVAKEVPYHYDLVTAGGTFIGTSRFTEFMDDKIKEQAVANLAKNGIQGLVVVGGNGSYQGAFGLHKLGVPAVGIPGTIDNDINTTDFTIGFDTTANVITDCLDRLRDTAESHNRCIIVEVMGRQCGDLALYSGIATQADVIVTAEYFRQEQEIINDVVKLKKANQRSVIVLVTENLFNVNVLAERVEKASGYVTRANVLGHQQRGGKPTMRDRFLAFMMGDKAVELLLKGHSGKAVALNGLTIGSSALDDHVQYKKKYHDLYYKMFIKNQSKK